MDKQAQNITHRILEFIEHKKFSIREFERNCGLSNGMISRLKKGHSLGVDKLSLIFDSYPSLNPNWVFKGQGDMLLDEHQLPVPDLITVNDSGKPNITMVDTKAAAGFPFHLGDEQWKKNQPHFSFPVPELQHESFTAFELVGDSMEPTLFKGDWVIAHPLERADQIRNGYIHIIITKDGPQAKRLLNRAEERNAIVLLSDNEAYHTQQIDLEEVMGIYAVKAKISFNLKNVNKDIYDELNQLQYQILDLQEMVKSIKK